MEVRETKVCTTCGKEKEEREFYKDVTTKDGLRFDCKECRSEYEKGWRRNNPGKIADISRRTQLKKKYGISPQQYNNMLSSQGDCCAICRCQVESQSKRLAVDHDHVTGAIRGIICDCCNKGLGFFKDSLDLLEKASGYLRDGRGSRYWTGGIQVHSLKGNCGVNPSE